MVDRANRKIRKRDESSYPRMGAGSCTLFPRLGMYLRKDGTCRGIHLQELHQRKRNRDGFLLRQTFRIDTSRMETKRRLLTERHAIRSR